MRSQSKSTSECVHTKVYNNTSTSDTHINMFNPFTRPILPPLWPPSVPTILPSSPPCLSLSLSLLPPISVRAQGSSGGSELLPAWNKHTEIDEGREREEGMVTSLLIAEPESSRDTASPWFHVCEHILSGPHFFTGLFEG